MNRRWMAIVAALMISLLAACGNQASPTPSPSANMPGMEHSGMNHSGPAEVPAGLKAAQNPKYKVGSQAVIQADHMPGMKGATATIAGAYETVVYAVSYTPTNGGQPVKNHKWVIQQELKEAGDGALKPGAQVTLEADHMPGMKGAKGTIDSAESTTVYMVDYTPTTGGTPVKNHKWVTESELTPVKS
ncbi:YdhK family protein [Paenibacillus aurantius]|uniref:YdhK family protein n=1 Tax=Paenibacillus aurantius TaxID=2918900 RepID=A0AA96LJG0_9BACL|nr:YdhK family protein [Paenibacillus aurantius]WNQ13201.1 YdhK family protein [Paenibacillus aurantius]